jgi:type IV pilus assembly protein PilW
MQVWYGQRQGTNNINYLPATAVTNWTQVVSVRIALLVSSRERVLDVQDNNTYALLGQNVQRAGITGAVITYPDDRRLRRVFSTSVSLRNPD